MALKRRNSASEPAASASSLSPARKKGKSGKDGVVREVKNWYSDRYQYVLVQRNILAFVTLMALCATLILSVVILGMTPLKSVKPFIIQVDDKTGTTKVVSTESMKEIQANEALKRYFLIKYISMREGYDADFAEVFYNNVRVMSSPSVFQAYSEQMGAKNPNSPVNLFERHTKRHVKVKSVVFLEPDLAQIRVRITHEGKLAMMNKQEDIDAVILVRFRFARLELTQTERDINPLGFRVEAYRLEQESL